MNYKFENLLTNIDHWIAFVVLTTIGAKQLFECLSNNINTNDNIDIKTMIPLAIATSIDALAVGITLSFLKINILISSLIIGIITFCISILGTILGNKLGTIYEKKSRILGGLILIIIGTKILVEHLYNL
jgi:putative Mn2+ efflux pump MntP